MMDLIRGILGGEGSAMFRVGVLVIASLSLIGIGYVLLSKSGHGMPSNRRR